MQDLIDVQENAPEYPYDIDVVGIRNLKVPVRILTKDLKEIPSIATFNLYASLSKEKRGVHMSRFCEVVQRMARERMLNYEFIYEILKMLKSAIGGRTYAKAKFDYFISKKSPITEIDNLIPVEIAFRGALMDDDKYEFAFDVKHTSMSLCPCSKAISKYNAHNQRAIVTVTISPTDPKDIIWIEDIVDIIDECTSGPVYSVLKRPDEKFVTEYAYEHPVFCEDVVRCIAAKIEEQYKGRYRIAVIRSEHLESIHPHNAYARLILRGDKDGGAK